MSGERVRELETAIERMTDHIASGISNDATWLTASQLERAGFDGAVIAEATTWDKLDESTRDLLRGFVREAFMVPGPREVTTTEDEAGS